MLLRLICMMRLLERDVVIGAREERIIRGEFLQALLRRIQTGGNCSAERPGWQRNSETHPGTVRLEQLNRQSRRNSIDTTLCCFHFVHGNCGRAIVRFRCAVRWLFYSERRRSPISRPSGYCCRVRRPSLSEEAHGHSSSLRPRPSSPSSEKNAQFTDRPLA